MRKLYLLLVFYILSYTSIIAKLSVNNEINGPWGFTNNSERLLDRSKVLLKGIKAGIYRRTGNNEQVYYPQQVDALLGWESDTLKHRLSTTFEATKNIQAILSWNIAATILVNKDTIIAEQVPITREPYAQFIYLHSGTNKIEVFTSQPERFSAFICDAGGFPINSKYLPIPVLTKNEIRLPFSFSSANSGQQNNKRISITGFQQGIGSGTSPSCGRFGFTDEAGLLDYSQYAFGVIGRQNRMGHPDNKQLAMWRISCRPPETDSYLYHIQPGKIDTIQDSEKKVNWISFRTQSTLHSTGEFHDRKLNDFVNFTTTVSLASPGFLVETDDNALVLSDFAPAGEFLYLGLPLKNGFVVRNTIRGGEVYNLERDGPLADNWILLWGNSRADAMESPLQIVLQHKPKEINFNRRKGIFEICTDGEFGYAILAAPYGIQWLKSEETCRQEWIEPTIKRCLFWSEALLAYPVDAEEFYSIDEEMGIVKIIQQFQYRYLSDDWNTCPLEVAPLPPPVALAASKVSEINFDDATNLNFPTKYGNLYGVIGNNRSVYSIPLPSLTRHFPLKPKGETDIARMFSEDFPEYLKYHDEQPNATPNPGAYAPITHYSFPLTLFNFIESDERMELNKRLNYYLPLVTDKNATYEFNNDLGGTSQFDNGKYISGKCFYWYKRTEPHTKVNYLSTYLHVSGITRFGTLSKQNIESNKFPLIEIDWGNGYSLYNIYLAALLTGNWDPIKKNWTVLKEAFRYYEVMQDWACMSAAYAEDGVIWNDGTNLGAYLGFSQMARLIGDSSSYDRSRYASAKHTVLRLAELLAGNEYFPRYFGGEPWWVHKFFYEDLTSSPRRFLCHPLLDGQIKREVIYNFSTEGLYPEIIDIFNSYLPDALRKCRQVIYESEPDCLERIDPKYLSWNGSFQLGRQEVYSLMMMEITDQNVPEKEITRKINQAYNNDRLFHEWITANPKYRRRIPKNWGKCSLLSMLETRDYPVWMENWIGINIKSAEYNPNNKEAVIVIDKGQGKINLGLSSRPESIMFENQILPIRICNKTMSLNIPHAGTLSIKF